MIAKGCAYEANSLGKELYVVSEGEITTKSYGILFKNEKGIEENKIMIASGTKLPMKKPNVITMTTTEDCQNNMEFKITEDERLVEIMELYGFPQYPAGHVEIDVEFKVETNGKLEVKATYKSPKSRKEVKPSICSIEAGRKNLTEERLKEQGKIMKQHYKKGFF